MSVKVEPYGKEPILMVTFTGTVTVDDFIAMYRLSNTYLARTATPSVWRVMDITKADVGFPVTMELMRNFTMDTPGGFADPRIHSVFASLHPMANLMRDLLAKASEGAIEITVYPGMGEALMFAQEALYDQSAGSRV